MIAIGYRSMFSVDSIIQSGGIIFISIIIFAESGLLIGFFLPGDTLLFGAGLAASQGKLSIYWLLFFVIIAAIIGDNVGYSVGRRAGKRLFKKKEGILFRQEYLERAENFYEKHGGKTIILARFTPIVRTFAPMIAGASKMPRKRFLLFNTTGAFIWGGGMPILGYTIGNKIPHLDQYIEIVIVGVIILSITLALMHVLLERQSRKLLFSKMHQLWRKLLLNIR